VGKMVVGQTKPKWRPYKVNFREFNDAMIKTGNADLVLNIAVLEDINYELGTVGTGPFDALANAYTTYCKEYLGERDISRIPQWVIRNNPEYLNRIVKEVEPRESPEKKKILDDSRKYREALERKANEPKQLSLI
jgi:hypothetical protein